MVDRESTAQVRRNRSLFWIFDVVVRSDGKKVIDVSGRYLLCDDVGRSPRQWRVSPGRVLGALWVCVGDPARRDVAGRSREVC